MNNDRCIIDPKGKPRKIHYAYDGFCGHAWVRAGLLKKEHQYAAGSNAIGNLVHRLVAEGWKRLFTID